MDENKLILDSSDSIFLTEDEDRKNLSLDKKRQILSTINNDPWLLADYGCLLDQIFEDFDNHNPVNALPKGRPGKRIVNPEQIKKALEDFYNHAQFSGTTISEFTADRFGYPVAGSTWNDWKKMYEDGKL